jgi:hypothetical protein
VDEPNICDVGPLGALYRVWGDGRQMVPGDVFDFFHLSGYTREELQAMGYFVWTSPQEKASWISEGDTSTFMNLVDNGLRSHENHSYGGWGGRNAQDINPATGTPNSNCASARFFGAAQRDRPGRRRPDVQVVAVHGRRHVPGRGRAQRHGTDRELRGAGQQRRAAERDARADDPLSLGAAPNLGAFVVGTARSYTATSTAQVTSTAGDATLSVHDVSPLAPGRLVNGPHSLASPLQVNGGALSGSPLAVKTYSGPVTSDPVALSFEQAIGATEALRSGSYSKSLTYTLSTTTP